MRAGGLLFVLLLPLLLIPTSVADGRGGARERWPADKGEKLLAIAREYMAATHRSEKDEILKRADELGRVPDRDVGRIERELFEIARSGPKSDGTGTCTAKYEPFPGKYILSGAGGGKKGIFIGLHGGGAGVGDGSTAQSQWGGATGKGLIGVFPTANLPGRATTWQSREVEAFVLAIVRELKRTYTIDTNRIYAAGHSLGGSGAYYIGLRHADMFAAVSPNAGGLKGQNISATESVVPGGFVANLYNTPIFITNRLKSISLSRRSSTLSLRFSRKSVRSMPALYASITGSGSKSMPRLCLPGRDGEKGGRPPRQPPVRND